VGEAVNAVSVIVAAWLGVINVMGLGRYRIAPTTRLGLSRQLPSMIALIDDALAEANSANVSPGRIL